MIVYVLKRILGLCAAGFLLIAATFAADYSGIWTGQITDRNGDVQDLSFRFNLRDNTLSGKMYGDNESVPIKDVVINGSQITFSVTTELNGDISTFIYSGQIDGDELTLVRHRLPKNNKVTSDKPPAENKQNQPQTVKLKRLA
jgi:hypothetical protein